jgi:hypothetical protein
MSGSILDDVIDILACDECAPRSQSIGHPSVSRFSKPVLHYAQPFCRRYDFGGNVDYSTLTNDQIEVIYLVLPKTRRDPYADTAGNRSDALFKKARQ